MQLQLEAENEEASNEYNTSPKITTKLIIKAGVLGPLGLLVTKHQNRLENQFSPANPDNEFVMVKIAWAARARPETTAVYRETGVRGAIAVQ